MSVCVSVCVCACACVCVCACACVCVSERVEGRRLGGPTDFAEVGARSMGGSRGDASFRRLVRGLRNPRQTDTTRQPRESQ